MEAKMETSTGVVGRQEGHPDTAEHQRAAREDLASLQVSGRFLATKAIEKLTEARMLMELGDPVEGGG